MKKYLTSCLIALLAACSGGDKADGNPSPAASAATTKTADYRVASHLSYPPFHFQNANGEPDGFEMEILQAVAKAGGFTVSVTNMPRNNLEKSLANNSVDIWSSTISVKPERLKQMDFSKPFLRSDNRYIYLLDNDANRHITAPEHFKGKKLAVNNKFNPKNETLAAQITGNLTNVVTTPSYHASMKEMYAGKVDGALDNGYVLDYYVKNQKEKIKVRPIVYEQVPKDFAFAVKKGNAELLAKLNKGLDTIKTDGTYEKIFEKWFGRQPTAAEK